MIRDILNRQPIARIGAPVRSWQSRGAELIETPNTDIGYVTGGNIVSGLTNALKSGLGFYGAIKDTQAQRAYNENLAQLAEQQYQDEQAKLAAEQDLKERALAQQAELKQQELAAQEARARQQREQQLADMAVKRQQELADAERKRQQELADMETRRQYALEDVAAKQAAEQAAYERNRQAAIADAIASKLPAEEKQQYLENPQAYDVKYSPNSVVGRLLGFREYNLKPRGMQSPLYPTEAKQVQPQNAYANVSDEDLLKGL